MHSQSPVGVTAGQAAGMSVQLKGVCVTDVTIWLWTNRYKVYGAKHFFRTIMQGTVTPIETVHKTSKGHARRTVGETQALSDPLQ